MFRNLTPIVRALLYVNLIVYVVQRFTGDGLRSDFLLSNFALWPIDSARLGGPAFQPWQVITYAFLHDPSSVLHILSNMFALYMFGPDVELVLGSSPGGRSRNCLCCTPSTRAPTRHWAPPAPFSAFCCSSA